MCQLQNDTNKYTLPNKIFPELCVPRINGNQYNLTELAYKYESSYPNISSFDIDVKILYRPCRQVSMLECGFPFYSAVCIFRPVILKETGNCTYSRYGTPVYNVKFEQLPNRNSSMGFLIKYSDFEIFFYCSSNESVNFSKNNSTPIIEWSTKYACPVKYF